MSLSSKQPPFGLRQLLIVGAVVLTSACQVARTPAPVGVARLRLGTPVRLSDRPALSPVAWAPDGEALAFTDGGGVWVAPRDRSRGRERKVAAARHATAVDWSTGTGLLAYIDQGAVIVLNPSRPVRRRIALPSRGGLVPFATHLAWAPRGDRLAVAVRPLTPQGRASRAGGAVWLVSSDGALRREIYGGPPGQEVGSLGWYPDAFFLLIGVGPAGSVTTLLRWRIAYTDRRVLPKPFPRIALPAISPDGRWIALAVLNGEAGEAVWVVGADGRLTPRSLGGGRGRISGIDWAPSSDKVVFTRVLDEAHGELWIADIQGGGRRRAASFIAEFPDPALPLVARWSPDASAIAYGSNSGSYLGHVWVVPLIRP